MEHRTGEAVVVKDLMYHYDLTRREADAYLACEVQGMTAAEYAEQIGCSRPLITQRLKAARIKMEGCE